MSDRPTRSKPWQTHSLVRGKLQPLPGLKTYVAPGADLVGFTLPFDSLCCPDFHPAVGSRASEQSRMQYHWPWLLQDQAPNIHVVYMLYIHTTHKRKEKDTVIDMIL